LTRFHFERPDGNPTAAQNILIHLNEFVPPQGFAGEVIEPSGDMEYEDNNMMLYEDLDVMEYES